MTDNYFSTKKKKDYWKSHLFGLLFCLILAIYTFIKYTPDNNAKNICLIVFLLSLLVSVFILLNLFSIKNYSITKNKLIQWSFLRSEKKVYELDEIESWTEKQLKGKSNKWEEITLYFKNEEKIKITCDYFENYFELKNEVTKGKKRDTEREELAERKIGKELAIIFLTISALLFYGAYNALHIEDIKSKDIIVLGDITSEKIEYVRGKHSYINVRLKKYPDLVFHISKKILGGDLVKKIISDVNKGDSIYLGIDKKDYREKLIKVDSLSVSDTYFFNENIGIESIKSKTTNYLKLSDNNFNKSENKHWDCFVFVLIGLFFFLMSMIGFSQTKNP
ncbi:hypothetical protein [Flavobacterium pectinovorum]|uniref:Uncharacterized protein n=1 Tax=Flavobacterium pectinovorum TaxID=29533 RepID=A0A502EUZ5_9FLAO|nr:hypothetical protein [Flavobacterium pectinovorum]TPG39941.1 hypothetical protein EAH81_11615 [Flavobacterium pectinovorum]